MELNQQNQTSSLFPPPDVTVKRKRGRPRKDRSHIPSKSSYVPRKKDQSSQNYGENAPVPPGFDNANGNQPQSLDIANNNTMNPMVGQVVTGVIEAAFDAGYLLSVRVGDSESSLRGIVFKPGHYVPVSAENDVAPSLQMIRRNEVPFPAGNQTPKRRGREKSEHHAPHPSNGSPPSNQLARVRAKQMPIVAAQAPDPLEGRGTVVPVVLQPLNLLNGANPAVEAPLVAVQPAHLTASKSKHSPPTQTIQEAVPKGSETDSGSAPQSLDGLISVAKKRQGSPVSAETRNGSGMSPSKMLPGDSGHTPEQLQDSSKPLLVEPLQAIQTSLADPAASVSHTFPERRTGKMTELLLAVQENLMERQMSDHQHHNFKTPKN